MARNEGHERPQEKPVDEQSVEMVECAISFLRENDEIREMLLKSWRELDTQKLLVSGPVKVDDQKRIDEGQRKTYEMEDKLDEEIKKLLKRLGYSKGTKEEVKKRVSIIKEILGEQSKKKENAIRKVFGEKFEKFRTNFFRYALKLSRNEANADDIVQEAARIGFEDCLKFGGFDVVTSDDRRFKVWMMSIVHNAFLDEVRRGRALKRGGGNVDSFDWLLNELGIEFADPETSQEVRDIKDDLRGAFDLVWKLLPHQRDTLLLFACGFTQKDIAKYFKVSVEVINRRIEEARKKLRAMREELEK